MLKDIKQSYFVLCKWIQNLLKNHLWDIPNSMLIMYVQYTLLFLMSIFPTLFTNFIHACILKQGEATLIWPIREIGLKNFFVFLPPIKAKAKSKSKRLIKLFYTACNFLLEINGVNKVNKIQIRRAQIHIASLRKNWEF